MNLNYLKAFDFEVFRLLCLRRVAANPYWHRLKWNSPKRLNREIADLEARTKTDRD